MHNSVDAAPPTVYNEGRSLPSFTEAAVRERAAGHTEMDWRTKK